MHLRSSRETGGAMVGGLDESSLPGPTTADSVQSATALTHQILWESTLPCVYS